MDYNEHKDSLYSKVSKEIVFPEEILDGILSNFILELVNTELTYYREKYGWLITKDNFMKLWKAIPEKRNYLVSVPISAATRNYHKYYLTKEEGLEVLEVLFKDLENSKISLDISSRARISTCMAERDKNPFYLNPKDEAFRLKELGAEPEGINTWIQMSIKLLKTEEDVESTYNMIAKAPHYTDVKNEVLSHAMMNDIFVESILDKVSQSSPVSIKRTCIEALSKKLGLAQNTIASHKLKPKKEPYMARDSLPFPEYSTSYYVYRDREYVTDEQLKIALLEQEKLERILMKFANVEDYHCLRLISQHSSMDNLAWLLPNLAKHEQLVSFVQARLDGNLSPRNMDLLRRR